MKKVLYVLGFFLVLFSLSSCDNLPLQTSQLPSTSTSKSSADESTSTTSSSVQKTYAVSVTANEYVEVSAVDGSALPTEVLDGESVEFVVKQADGTKGDVQVKNGDVLLTPDANGVYKIEAVSADVVINTSGVVPLGNFKVTVEANDLVSLTAVDGSALPESVVEGTSIEFVAKVADNTKGELVVKVGDDVLTPNENGVYSYTLNEDSTFVTSGIVALANYAVTLDVPSYVSVSSAEGTPLAQTVLEGNAVSFKLAYSEIVDGDVVVKVGEDVLTPDENGVYSYTPTADFAIEVSGLTASYKVEFTSPDNLSVQLPSTAPESNLYEEAHALEFSLVKPSFTVYSEDFAVLANGVAVEPNAEGNYSIDLSASTSITFAGTVDADLENVVVSGSGLEADPVQLDSAVELIKFAADYADGTYTDTVLDNTGIYVDLNSDIDFEGYAWNPIDLARYGFVGTFNGNGHVLSNYEVPQDFSGQYGFIASSLYAIVNDLHIKTNYIFGETQNANIVGGIVGIGEMTDVNGSSFEGEITFNNNSADPTVGGMVGLALEHDDQGWIGTFNADSVDITVTAAGDVTLGGIVGISGGSWYGIDDCEDKILISNSYVHMNAVVGGSWVGGLAAVVSPNSTLSGNYVEGQIITLVSSNAYIGGVFAVTQGDVYCMNNTFNGVLAAPAGTINSEEDGNAVNPISPMKGVYYNNYNAGVVAEIQNDYSLAVSQYEYYVDDTTTEITNDEFVADAMKLNRNVFNFNAGEVSLKSFDEIKAASSNGSYTVTFEALPDDYDSNDVSISPVMPSDIDSVPNQNGDMVFVGWTLDPEGLVDYNPNMVLTQDTKLYAQWVDVSIYYGAYSDGNNLIYILDETGLEVYDSEKNIIYPVYGEYAFDDNTGYFSLIPEDEDYTLILNETIVSPGVLSHAVCFSQGQDTLAKLTAVDTPDFDNGFFAGYFVGAFHDANGNILLGNDTGFTFGDLSVNTSEFMYMYGQLVNFYDENNNYVLIQMFGENEFAMLYNGAQYDFTRYTLDDIKGTYKVDFGFGEQLLEINAADNVMLDGQAVEDGAVDMTSYPFNIVLNGVTYSAEISSSGLSLVSRDNTYSAAAFVPNKIADYAGVYSVAVAEDSTVYLEINEDMTVKYNGQAAAATVDAYGILTFDVEGVTYTMSSTGALSASGVDTPYVLTKVETVSLDDFAGAYASEAGKVVISDEEISYLGETVIDYTLGYTDLEFTLADGSEVVLTLTDDGISALVTPVDGDATTVAYASYEAITLGDFTGAYLADIVDEGDHLIFVSAGDDYLAFLNGVSCDFTFEDETLTIQVTDTAKLTMTCAVSDAGDVVVSAVLGSDIDIDLTPYNSAADYEGEYKSDEHDVVYGDSYSVDGESFAFAYAFDNVVYFADYVAATDSAPATLYDAYELTFGEKTVHVVSSDNKVVFDAGLFFDTSLIAGEYTFQLEGVDTVSTMVIGLNGEVSVDGVQGETSYYSEGINFLGISLNINEIMFTVNGVEYDAVVDFEGLFVDEAGTVDLIVTNGDDSQEVVAHNRLEQFVGDYYVSKNGKDQIVSIGLTNSGLYAIAIDGGVYQLTIDADNKNIANASGDGVTYSVEYVDGAITVVCNRTASSLNDVTVSLVTSTVASKESYFGTYNAQQLVSGESIEVSIDATTITFGDYTFTNYTYKNGRLYGKDEAGNMVTVFVRYGQVIVTLDAADATQSFGMVVLSRVEQ